MKEKQDEHTIPYVSSTNGGPIDTPKLYSLLNDIGTALKAQENLKEYLDDFGFFISPDIYKSPTYGYRKYINFDVCFNNEIEFGEQATAVKYNEIVKESVQDYFNMNEKFDLHYPKSNSSSCVVALELTYHVSIAFAQNIFFAKLLAQYGNCIISEIPKVDYLNPKGDKVKSYYLLDLTAETLPAAKVYFQKRIGPVRNPEIDIKILSDFKFCLYCETRCHNRRACPLRLMQDTETCRHCLKNGNKHNYLCCFQNG